MFFSFCTQREDMQYSTCINIIYPTRDSMLFAQRFDELSVFQLFVKFSIFFFILWSWQCDPTAEYLNFFLYLSLFVIINFFLFNFLFSFFFLLIHILFVSLQLRHLVVRFLFAFEQFSKHQIKEQYFLLLNSAERFVYQSNVTYGKNFSVYIICLSGSYRFI